MKTKKSTTNAPTPNFQHGYSAYKKDFRLNELFTVQINDLKPLMRHQPCLVFRTKKNSSKYHFIPDGEHTRHSDSTKKSTKQIIFPLYREAQTSVRKSDDHEKNNTTPTRRFSQAENEHKPFEPNLNAALVKQIAAWLGLSFIPEKEPEGTVCYLSNAEVRDEFKISFAAIDLFHYIYAVLNSAAYRNKHAENLKVHFMQIPFPRATSFWELTKWGNQLRQHYLLSASGEITGDADRILKEIDKTAIL